MRRSKRKLLDSVKFVPLSCDLPVVRLSPLLRALHSPHITDSSLTETVAQLAESTYVGVTKLPAIGPAPDLVINHPDAPYWAAAMPVAEYFCRETSLAAYFDPQVQVGQHTAVIGLTVDDAVDALYEPSASRGSNEVHSTPRGQSTLGRTPLPLPEFDRYFRVNPDPAGDAMTVATHLLNDPRFPN